MRPPSLLDHVRENSLCRKVERGKTNLQERRMSFLVVGSDALLSRRKLDGRLLRVWLGDAVEHVSLWIDAEQAAAGDAPADPRYTTQFVCEDVKVFRYVETV